jgi:hypothetical protein
MAITYKRLNHSAEEIDEAIISEKTHVNDNVSHITATERETWNNNIDVSNDLTEKMNNVINPYIILKDHHKHKFSILPNSIVTVSTVDGSNFSHEYNKIIFYDNEGNEIDYFGITNAQNTRTFTYSKDINVTHIALSVTETAHIKVCVQNANSIEYELSVLNNNALKISDNNHLSSITVKPTQLRNGSLNNGTNGKCVSIPVIFTKADKIEVITNRPNKTNCTYHYEFATVTDFVNDILNQSCYENKIAYDNNANNTYTLGENGVGVQIAICEYNTETSETVALRKTDFADYVITIFDKSTDNFNKYMSISDNYCLSTVNIKGSQIRNGTTQNGSNANCISTPAIWTKSKNISVHTNRPNRESCIYHYEFITVTDFVKDINNQSCYENKVPIDNNISNTYTLGENGVGVQICLAEIDTTTGAAVQLRKTDFADYTITVMTEETENKSGIPNFYTDYVAERIKTIRNKDVLIGNGGDSFIFITDTHNENNHYSALIAEKIMSDTAVNKTVYGGDYINEPSSKEQALTFHFDRMAKMRMKDNVVFVKGNHDTNPYGEGRLTTEEYYSIYNRHIEDKINTGKNCYFFKDNEPQKIRYYYLDTGEYGSLDETQIDWFTETVTALTSEYTIVIFMHHTLHGTGTIDDRTNFTYFEALTSIKNVLDNVTCTVACVIGGHTHVDMSDTTGSFPIIVTTCDAHGIQASHATTDDRTANSINEQAFDVFHLDTANRKIYVTRIGGGQNNALTSNDFTVNDREFTY